MTAASANDQPQWAPRVLLAFDDFSLSGQHLAQHVVVPNCTRLEASVRLPGVDTAHISVAHYTPADSSSPQPTLSCVYVASGSLADDASTWELTSALVDTLSSGGVQELLVAASLHLPQAKAHAAALENVYHSALTPPTTTALPTPRLSPSKAAFASLDASWGLRDTFLSSLVHWLHVEQAFATHLLIRKGYRPGRDGSGTQEALVTLAEALASFTDDAMTVDVQKAATHAHRWPTRVTSGKQVLDTSRSLIYQ